MPKFDASLVDTMTYDFTAWGVDAQGVMAEPSSEQVSTLIEVIRQVMPVTEDEDGKPMLDLEELSVRFEDKPEEVEAILNAGIAATFNDQPSADQIHALPHRAKQAFYGWVFGTLFSPES